MDQTNTGKFIAQCRQAAGLTQQELADRLGVTNKAVSKWETGKGLPDVSMYESLCKELNITLNELFAGRHITTESIAGQSDKNLEELLRDYYRMKKQRRIVLIICGVIASIAITHSFNTLALFAAIVGFEHFAVEDVRTEVLEYDRFEYVQEYRGDLDSDLSIFPDKLDGTMEVLLYDSSLKTGMFDTDGYIILDYCLPQNEFEREVERLSELSLTIEYENGEGFTNRARYSEDLYPYPAYVTIDGFGHTYEYALIDHGQNRIVCVYLAYPDPTDFPYPEYLRLDPSSYATQDPTQSFSMYNHSFDGGSSFVEFDD